MGLIPIEPSHEKHLLKLPRNGPRRTIRPGGIRPEGSPQKHGSVAMQNDSKLETILKWIVLVIAAVVALKIVASVLAIAFVVGGFLLTKILPLVLLVWLILKLIEWWKPRNGTVPVESDS